MRADKKRGACNTHSMADATQLSRTSARACPQVLALWQKGTAEEGHRAESLHVQFVTLNSLREVVDTGAVGQGTLMPEHRAAVDLYMQVRTGTGCRIPPS